MYSFIERIDCQDEFVFIYNGIKYEIVYDDRLLLLFFSDTSGEILIDSFADKADFLQRCRICGTSILELIDQIEVI